MRKFYSLSQGILDINWASVKSNKGIDDLLAHEIQDIALEYKVIL
jgi:hypothetical protein